MNDEKAEPAYTTLTAIGEAWGLTNQALGDLLRCGGYRDGSRPTTKALDEGLAILQYLSDYPSYLWSRDLVGEFLERSGREKRRATDGKQRELFLVVPLDF